MSQAHARYGAYKDSGVEWLGEVPAHWDLNRFKDFAEILSGYSPEEVKPDSHGNNAYYKVDDLNSLSETGHITQSTWHTNYTKCVYKKDILLLPKRGMSILTNKVGITNTSCIFDTNLMGLRLSPKYVDIKFIFYWTINVGLSKLADITTIPQLNNKHIYPIVIQLPKRAEQTAIAAYLDSKTAQLDRKIELLGQKAAQYGKLKQSLINETVTRGLNKTVAMKDSGGEWIGEIPAHWEVQRIGTAFEERSEKVNDTDYPPLSVSMGGIVPQMESVAKTDNNENRKRVAVGDYVINSRSDRRGASGISIYDGSVSVISIVLAPKRSFFGKYLHHLFRSYSFIEEFYRVGRGIVDDLWTTRYSVMKGIEFAYPSYEEQKNIAAYLDSKTAHIDRIVATINTQIDKLKELRKTLINDVVTGKICIFKQDRIGSFAQNDVEWGLHGDD